MDINLFYENLTQEILQESASWTTAGNFDSSFKENAFTSIVVNDLSDAGILESPIVCYHEVQKGGATAKINAYSIPDDDSKIDLVIADYHPYESIEKLNQQDIDKRFSQATRFLEFAFDEGYLNVDPSTDAYSMLREIYDQKKKVDRINVILITNGISVARKVSLETKALGNIEVQYEIWDLERFRRFRSSGSTQEPIEIDITEYYPKGLSCVKSNSDIEGYSTSVAIIPGGLLYELYDRYGSRLLELNVRSYLQARGKINKGILETILTQPERFLTYNNGITIVAEGMVFSEDERSILKIIGLQIVNGGQTTASIHRAVKENKAAISKLFVQAKITIVPPANFEEVVPLISKFSNTQNKVSDVDLRANHPFHVGFERMSKRVWIPGETSMWFYERARGGYQTERSKTSTKAQRAKFDTQYPADQKISKEDVARYSNTWIGLPHIVSKGGQKNFTKFMESIGGSIGKDWEPSIQEYRDLIAKAIFYRAVSDIAKALKIPAFKINVINYTAALIVDKAAKRIDLNSIWERQLVDESLRSQIVEWMPKIQSLLLEIAAGKNPGEVFKEESCWKKFLELTKSWQIDEAVAKNLVSVVDSSSYLDVDVENNIARCLQLSAKEWFEISQWGRESGVLEPWQIGVANTLSGYANLGWQKKPSEKQAKHGVVVIQKFKDSASSNATN